MHANSKFVIFLLRHCPNPITVYCCGAGLIFIDRMFPIFTPLQTNIIYVFNLFSAIYLLVFFKYIRYEFKMRKDGCEGLFLFFRKKFSQCNYNLDNDFSCNEIFDDKNNFKYTEVVVSLKSDYRFIIEDYKANKYPILPKKFKLDVV